MRFDDQSEAGGTHPNGDETAIDDGWAAISGTSAAAPQVAGVCALIKHACAKLTPFTIKSILKTTATDVTTGTSNMVCGVTQTATVGPDLATGHGLVNAYKAVLSAKIKCLPIITPGPVGPTVGPAPGPVGPTRPSRPDPRTGRPRRPDPGPVGPTPPDPARSARPQDRSAPSGRRRRPVRHRSSPPRCSSRADQPLRRRARPGAGADSRGRGSPRADDRGGR